jgi:hypothetical protein
MDVLPKKNYGFDRKDKNATNKNWIWSLKPEKIGVKQEIFGLNAWNFGVWPAEHVTSVIQFYVMERLIWENNEVRKNHRNGLQLILVQDLD